MGWPPNLAGRAERPSALTVSIAPATTATPVSRVTLYTAGHLHTAVPHCSHNRAPHSSHSRAPGEQWARLCVFTLQGCVQAARLCRGSPVSIALGPILKMYIPGQIRIYNALSSDGYSTGNAPPSGNNYGYLYLLWISMTELWISIFGYEYLEFTTIVDIHNSVMETIMDIIVQLWISIFAN